MRKRKTFNVQEFRIRTNKTLADYDNGKYYMLPQAEESFLEGLCTQLEHVLMDTGNYNGFYFIDTGDSKVNTPGYYRRKYM